MWPRTSAIAILRHGIRVYVIDFLDKVSESAQSLHPYMSKLTKRAALIGEILHLNVVSHTCPP